MNWNDDLELDIRKTARAKRRPSPQELRRQFGPLFAGLKKTMRFHHDKMIRDLVSLCQFLPKKSLGVEIGSFAGESALLFLLSGKVGHLACVDPWLENYYRDRQVPAAEETFDKLQRSCGGKIAKHQMTGLAFLEARAQSKVKFDFIYIDGDHSYETVKREIAAAIPLIKPTGLLCGHDYGFRKSLGVERAVKEMCGAADVLFSGYSWLVFAERLQNPDAGRPGSDITQEGPVDAAR